MLGEYDDGEPGGARYILYASLWHPDLGEPTLPEERKWPGALHPLWNAISKLQVATRT
jgi:hypothetical protein